MTTAQIILFLLFGGLLAAAVLAACLRAGRSGGRPERIPYEKPDFRDRAGFAVSDLPGDEIIELKRCALLHKDTVGELEFRVEPGWKALLRLARASSSLHLEEFAGQYAANQVLYMDGVRVLVRTSPGGLFLGSWTRGDFHYALYLPAGEMGLAGGLIDDFIHELDATAG